MIIEGIKINHVPTEHELSLINNWVSRQTKGELGNFTASSLRVYKDVIIFKVKHDYDPRYVYFTHKDLETGSIIVTKSLSLPNLKSKIDKLKRRGNYIPA